VSVISFVSVYCHFHRKCDFQLVYAERGVGRKEPVETATERYRQEGGKQSQRETPDKKKEGKSGGREGMK
jgi:hypothetical protein